MESKAIPTEKQFLDEYARNNGHKDWNWLATQESSQTLLSCTKEIMHEYAVLFAKHHVSEALKAASKCAHISFPDSILNAYPSELIK